MKTKAFIKMCALTMLAVGVVLSAANEAAARDWGYAPLTLQKLSQVFPQTCIQTNEAMGKPFETHGVEGIYKEDLFLSGSTKLGRKWFMPAAMSSMGKGSF